jgi:hypothetical protein
MYLSNSTHQPHPASHVLSHLFLKPLFSGRLQSCIATSSDV